MAAPMVVVQADVDPLTTWPVALQPSRWSDGKKGCLTLFLYFLLLSLCAFFSSFYLVFYILSLPHVGILFLYLLVIRFVSFYYFSHSYSPLIFVSVFSLAGVWSDSTG